MSAIHPRVRHSNTVQLNRHKNLPHNYGTEWCVSTLEIQLTSARARTTIIFWKRFSFSSHPDGSGALCAEASARQSCHCGHDSATDVQMPFMEGMAISACCSVFQLCKRATRFRNFCSMGKTTFYNLDLRSVRTLLNVVPKGARYLTRSSKELGSGLLAT